jgi:hypothetical protein
MSRQSAWRRFVKERRGDLHRLYPCATPTRRRLCPRHGCRIGAVTGICKPCRDELFDHLADEYRAGLTAARPDPEANVPQGHPEAA